MKYAINLLPKPEETPIDKIVYFSFHYLRYILVITQFVVICVFFFRFRVDQEIVDLKDGLKQKKEIITSTKSLLEEVEVVDERINISKGVLDQQDNLIAMIRYFLSKIPSRFEIQRVNISEGKIQFTGSSPDVDSIQVFYDSLRADKEFESVTFDNVERSTEGYLFMFTMNKFNPNQL